MSLQLRKFFLTAGAVLGLLLFLLFCATGVLLLESGAGGEFPARLIWNLAGTGCVALFSTAGGLGFRRLFRRTAALEIFFFLAFIVSLSFDALKILNVYFINIHIAAFYGVLITRTVYFGFFMGLLFLFTGSLFSGGRASQKMGAILGLVLVFSLALAYSLPVDETVFQPNLLYGVGGKDYVLLLRFGLEALTLFGFVRSAYLVGSAQEWQICGAVGLVLAGRELVFFLASPVSIIAGFALLVCGSILFSHRIYEKHLWI